MWGDGAGRGGGAKLLCVLWPPCVDLDPGPEQLFSLYMDRLICGGGLGSELQVPPPPPLWALAGEEF